MIDERGEAVARNGFPADHPPEHCTLRHGHLLSACETFDARRSAAFITTLLVTPVLSNLRLVSFVDKQTARGAEQQAVQNERAQLSEVAAQMRPSTFDAHQDKLALAPQPVWSQAS